MKKLITIFFLIANMAQAQFNGFPISENYTNADANFIATNLHPMQQLYSGVVERVNLINNGGSTITPLELVNTYVCSAGTGFSYTVDGSNTYTNILLFTTNVTVTNTFTPFVYSYSDTSGVHSATAMPFVTRGMISDIDAKIDQLIPYFVSVTTIDNNYYTPARTNWNIDPVNYTVPQETKAGLFTRAGIGIATNLVTNRYGFVYDGDAYYTRQPATTSLYLLAEGTYTSNGWATRDMYDLDLYYYKTNMPIIRYNAGGTNPITSINLDVSGSYLVQSNQSTVATSKTYTVTASNTPLDLLWYSVTNISSASASFNTNDVWAVIYTNRQLTYGSAIDKYFLTASDYDERYRVLTNLTRTAVGANALNHPNVSAIVTGRTYASATYSWQSNDWAGVRYTASNSVETASNWTNNWLYGLGAEIYVAVTELGIPGQTNYLINIGDHINDDYYYAITNMPTNLHSISFCLMADADGSRSNYYDFKGSFPIQDAMYRKLNDISTYTNKAYEFGIQYWENPILDTVQPNWGSNYIRYQRMNYEYWIINWQPGLKYK